MNQDQQKLTIELLERNEVKITLVGEVDMIANMVFSSMLENPLFAAIVMTCANNYENQLESSRKALLN